jgi:TRAP-type C4-dicarboxylate transport system substrate-binding protein
MGSFSIFINPDFLDSLPEKDRKAVLSVSGEKLSRLAGRAWGECATRALGESRSSGVKIVEVGEDEPMAVEFKDLVEKIDDNWINEAIKKGVDGKKALQELRDIVEGSTQ